MERGVGGQRGKEICMTVNELLQRINEIGTTGEETVVLEVNGEEYQLANHVFEDDGDLVISTEECD